MKILLVRHGDPDYENDRLTETGKKEAALLVKRMQREAADAYYVSPLRRAKETAAPFLQEAGKEAKELPWLEEFPETLDVTGDPFLQSAFPDTRKNAQGEFRKRIVWDQMPSTWKNDERYYALDRIGETPVAKASDLVHSYERVCSGLDALLAGYGYRREGMLYHTEQGTNKSIAMFCHFGVSCAILSHLWGISPYILWAGLVMAPSSVTELNTEEREKGTVIFRAAKIGDVSHLYEAHTEPTFAARFCSVYENVNERH